jgi:Ca2+-transporting ATPase
MYCLHWHLAMNKGNTNIMQRHPLKHNNIISPKHWQAIITYAIVLTACIFSSYAYCIAYLDFNKLLVNNMLFWSLALAQLWHSFNLSKGYIFIFKNEVFQNKYVWFALLICLLVMLANLLFNPAWTGV